MAEVEAIIARVLGVEWKSCAGRTANQVKKLCIMQLQPADQTAGDVLKYKRKRDTGLGLGHICNDYSATSSVLGTGRRLARLRPGPE
jgi:hypothetical protein